MNFSRRDFLMTTGALAGGVLIPSATSQDARLVQSQQSDQRPDYTIRIASTPIEIAAKKIISLST